VDEEVLAAFAKKGLLLPKEVAHWRAPTGETFSRPWANEVVSFLAFHEQKGRISHALVPAQAPQ